MEIALIQSQDDRIGWSMQQPVAQLPHDPARRRIDREGVPRSAPAKVQAQHSPANGGPAQAQAALVRQMPRQAVGINHPETRHRLAVEALAFAR
jgi:hypothetical protein